jgi:phosphatidylglycerol:prolipoprotein diacylglycerol transferase
MAVAWTIARVGCFVAHDHKGSLSTFPLAVDFPGGARHDLGLYEAILSAFLALICAWAFNRKLPTGSVAALLCLLYAPVRFGMDFLRAEDISGADSRYAGLTPAQYGCVALFVFSVYAWRRAQAAATAESVSD